MSHVPAASSLTLSLVTGSINLVKPLLRHLDECRIRFL